jgi:hypothetical protein
MDDPPVSAHTPSSTPPSRVALIELLDGSGHCVRQHDVQAWPVRLGRALDQDLVLSDPFVAPHHATLELAPDNTLMLRVAADALGGVRIAKTTHASGTLLPLPANCSPLHIGQSILRVRQAQDSLPAQRPLPLHRTALPAWALTAGLLLLVLQAASHWVGLDPGADSTAWLSMLVTWPLALAGWCAAWALLSKLFQGRFEFFAHVRVLLPWLLASVALGLVLPSAAAASGWPWLWRSVSGINVLLMAGLVYQHLALVLPNHTRRVGLAVVATTVLGSAISMMWAYRATDRLSRAPYMSTLPLPMLHVASTTTPELLVQELTPVAEQLKRRVRKARAEEAEAGEDSSTD